MGGLELAPAFKAISTTPSTYIWSIAADQSGNLYAATGAPAACIASPRRDSPPPSSSHRNCRCRRWPWTRTAFSMPPPIRMARFIALSVGQHCGGQGKAEPDKTKSASEFSASVYFDPGTKYIWDLVFDNCRQPVCRDRRSRRNLSRHSQGGAFRLLQKRRSAHSRVGGGCQRQSDRRLGWQRTGLPDQAQRRRLRALQRAQKRNHRAGHRQGGKYLCRRRRERSAPGATPSIFPSPMHNSHTRAHDRGGTTRHGGPERELLLHRPW